LFKEGITPDWDDELNKEGGSIKLQFNPEYTNKLWEDILLAFITEKSNIVKWIAGVRY